MTVQRSPQSNKEIDFSIDPELNFQRPELLQFLAYWEQKREGRQFPSRADIKRREIQDLLPWLHMYDVEGPQEFHVRLAGTKIEALLPAQKYPGKPISVLPHLVYRRSQITLELVMQLHAPLRTHNSQAPIPGQEFRGIENLYAPLSSNGADIDIIVGVTLLEQR